MYQKRERESELELKKKIIFDAKMLLQKERNKRNNFKNFQFAKLEKKRTHAH